jgi:hypothetical protein
MRQFHVATGENSPSTLRPSKVQVTPTSNVSHRYFCMKNASTKTIVSHHKILFWSVVDCMTSD